MWSAATSEVDGRAGLRLAVLREAAPATYADVVDAWRGDARFRAWFNDLLAGVAFDAFRWETPPVAAQTAGRPFECVVLDSPGLARRPDPDAFAEHFAPAAATDVLAFPNLRADAILVVPRPCTQPSAYGHLAAFVRQAPQAQQQALWQAVGTAMARRVGAKPVWLSTAGAGVAWLHVRLDDRPKYYGYAPYAAQAGAQSRA